MYLFLINYFLIKLLTFLLYPKTNKQKVCMANYDLELCLQLDTSSHVASVDLAYLPAWTIDRVIKAYLFQKQFLNF